eukprot:TRINITY_DN35557_c0_g1_i1.p1 TRINITY_DN35557_c0_g1~~TRINITY_DN35557_c0_g1_i1.p1  ORF type:complete len:362 (-),score=47.41 TRINITY_DN35557_c0_g1_i1:136-1221(-)
MSTQWSMRGCCQQWLILRAPVAVFVFAVVATRLRPVAGQVGFERKECAHCTVGEPFTEFLKDKDADKDGAYSQVHLMWATHVEVVRTTSDNGGWEKPTLHSILADEAIRAWKDFSQNILPSLPQNHDVIRRLDDPNDPSDLREAFLRWQVCLQKAMGNVEEATASKESCSKRRVKDDAADIGSNWSWPELAAIPEYARLRLVVDKLSRRYMERSGMAKEDAWSLKTSTVSFASVQKPGDQGTTSSLPGHHHIALFFAKVGQQSSRLRLGDPRGHSYPFGREFVHIAKAGDLIIFPSWMSHLQSTTPFSEKGVGMDDAETVVFTFHIAPQSGSIRSEDWWTDPSGQMRFSRAAAIEPTLFQS